MFEKIVLIEPKSEGQNVFSKFRLPRLGLPIIGAVLKKELNCDVKIYFQEIGRMNWEDILSADLVGISTITPTAPEAYALLRKIKRPNGPLVVMGGPHVSFLPEEALLKGADFVVRGEGEETIVELIRYLSEGKGTPRDIAGLSYMENRTFQHNPDRERIADLSSLPWPDISLIEGLERLKVVPVLTSRGCPFDCKFCSVTGMFGRRYRFRDKADVLAELEMLYEKNPKATFFFYDDNFTASPTRTMELLREMKERGIMPKWTAQVRVDVTEDDELMQLMQETNCRFLYVGLESINPATLEAYRKSQTVADVKQAVEVIHQHRIKIHGMFVLGSDEDDRKTIRETVQFARKSGIDTVQFMILTPIPGTETYEELKGEGRLIVDDWSKFTGHHVVFEPKKMSVLQLQKEAGIRTWRKFYSLWSCIKPGFLFRWKQVAIHIYGHHGIARWISWNRGWLKELRIRDKMERSFRKIMSKEKKSIEKPECG
ncbi:MAG: radical SAM protein [Actinomycetota bacterium]|nr:radical SAM protein [Actinomycetota bacterium]